jgi:DNA-binding transcriptional MerR regulator
VYNVAKFYEQEKGMSEGLRIGELARQIGVNPRTIRYYEQIGLLPRPRRGANGYRVYDQTDAARLQFIRRVRALDFSLDDIGEILAFRERGEAPCLYVLHVIDEQIDQVAQRITELERLRQELIEVREQAQGLPVDDVEGKECVCHLIQNRELDRSLVFG